jgi:endonuclease/exonuclease/phosphatase family metal-dependent hydrolase
MDNGKKLCLINTHNSAFDDAAEMRKQEMEMIRNLALEEYAAGSYVIIGGDWNINPPGFTRQFVTGDAIYYVENPIDSGFMPPGWKWAADLTIPTNRMVTTPYKLGETQTSVLDFFLCSPNVEVLYVQAMSRLFIHSDHNPVFLKVVLN